MILQAQFVGILAVKRQQRHYLETLQLRERRCSNFDETDAVTTAKILDGTILPPISQLML
jgi:hypothetical protein